MAAGPPLAQAIKEVAALPRDAYERAVVEPILVSFQHMLGQDSSQISDDEQEFIMAMYKSWEDARSEARAEARARDVLTVLRVRGITVPDAVREQIWPSRISSGWSGGSRRPASPPLSER